MRKSRYDSRYTSRVAPRYYSGAATLGQGVGGVAAPSAPTAGQWTVGDDGSDGRIIFNVSAATLNGGTLLDIEYRIDGGSAQSSGASAIPAEWTHSPLTNGVQVSVQIRFVTNGGTSGWSDTKTATPTTGSLLLPFFDNGMGGRYGGFLFESGINQLFTDTGLTTHVTANGQAVAGFLDSANAHTGVQASAGAKPTFVSASDAMSFDGGDYLLTDFAYAGGGLTMAFRGTLTTSAQQVMGSSTGGGTARCWIGLNSSGYFELGFSSSVVGAANLFSTDAVVVADVTAAGVYRVYVNGVSVASGTTAGITNTVAFALGCSNRGGTPTGYALGTVRKALAISVSGLDLGALSTALAA